MKSKMKALIERLRETSQTAFWDEPGRQYNQRIIALAEYDNDVVAIGEVDGVAVLFHEVNVKPQVHAVVVGRHNTTVYPLSAHAAYNEVCDVMSLFNRSPPGPLVINVTMVRHQGGIDDLNELIQRNVEAIQELNNAVVMASKAMVNLERINEGLINAACNIRKNQI